MIRLFTHVPGFNDRRPFSLKNLFSNYTSGLISRLLTTLLLVVIMPLALLGEDRQEACLEDEVTVRDLSRKWKLDKYKVFLYSFDPEENEQDDYMHLHSDMTFTSISEGKYETGTWRLDPTARKIWMTDDQSGEKVALMIHELTKHMLIISIEDPSDDEAQYLKIHFKSI